MKKILVILGILLFIGVGSAAETKIDISQISQTDFPNSTVSNNLANWNATYNVTYQNNTVTLLTYFNDFFNNFNSTYQNNTITLLTYFDNFMTTFNSTYQDAYITIQNNLVN